MDADSFARRWLDNEPRRKRHELRFSPDWVIIGVPHEDSVTVYAGAAISMSLSQALTHFDELNRDRIEKGEIGPEPFEVRGRLARVFTGHGDTYAEAMADLTGKWSPDDTGSTEYRQRRQSMSEIQKMIESRVEIDDEIIDAEIVEDEDGHE